METKTIHYGYTSMDMDTLVWIHYESMETMQTSGVYGDYADNWSLWRLCRQLESMETMQTIGVYGDYADYWSLWRLCRLWSLEKPYKLRKQNWREPQIKTHKNFLTLYTPHMGQYEEYISRIVRILRTIRDFEDNARF